MRRSSQKLETKFPRRPEGLVVGVDGGGTKTLAVIMDEKQRVLGKGVAGPSNPLRVGIPNAVAAINEAIEKACDASSTHISHIRFAEIGLAGVSRSDLRRRMKSSLGSLGSLEIVTDADIALFGATGGEPGVVVIAGTGSIACGINAAGRKSTAGGWGPLSGDEGSGSWIARRALQLVAKSIDGREEATGLVQAAVSYFQLSSADDLLATLNSPQMTNDRIAGFCKPVIEIAKAGDKRAKLILEEAGRELGIAACAVIRKLSMTRHCFQVSYVGGVFAAGSIVLDGFAEEIWKVASKAYISSPILTPAYAAARMAQLHTRQVSLAS
jgi:N-acetylglucosamine kinase-like BadF-type ATPase